MVFARVFEACKDIIQNCNIYDFHGQIRKIRHYDLLRAYDFVWYDHGNFNLKCPEPIQNSDKWYKNYQF